eukprot:355442-Chlamydomonas_euryale.AAC.3
MRGSTCRSRSNLRPGHCTVGSVGAPLSVLQAVCNACSAPEDGFGRQSAPPVCHTSTRNIPRMLIVCQINALCDAGLCYGRNRRL